MNDNSRQDRPGGAHRPWHRRRSRIALGALLLVAAYGLAAYVVAPFFWEEYARDHPLFEDTPRLTHTGDGHPGDPLNVALVGTTAEVQKIFAAAKWYPANALSLKSDVRIAEDTVMDRPYDNAPVSSLYLFGRKEDLAFEQPVGNNPRRRNHLRLWLTGDVDSDNRPLWIGATSYDESVGFSHTTGQITHHIAPDLDAERDRVFDDLEKTGELLRTEKLDGFHKTLKGRNGGGDPWYTDGVLWVGWIR